MIEIKVSVIVPVYNAEKYLQQCIDSILAQTLEQIEIILINDGSTDGSKAIITAALSTDNRIVFIDGENAGPGAARNKGLKAARGKYIGFVDADDWISPLMYEQMYKNITENNCQLAICNVSQFDESKNTFADRIKLNAAVINLEDNKSNELINFLHFRYDNANWNKLYAAEIISSQHLLFNEKMKLWEDLLFNGCFLIYASAAVIVNESFYHYRIHNNSLMTLQAATVSDNFNLFYSGFLQAASMAGNLSLANTFKKEMNQASIGNVVNFVRLFSTSQPGFWKFILKFREIIKKFNSDIYLQGNGKTGLVHQLNRVLLRHRAFYLLGLLVAVRKFSRLPVWSY